MDSPNGHPPSTGPPVRPGSPAGGTPAVIAVAFVLVSLASLAIVPVVTGRRVADLNERVRTVLEPAQLQATDYAFRQVRAMARVQASLLTDNPVVRRRFQDGYNDGLIRADSAYDALLAHAREIDLTVQEAVLQLGAAADDWHVHHLSVVQGSITREEFQDLLPAEQALYENLLSSATRLEDLLDGYVDDARGRIDEALDDQRRLTFLLSIIAGAATFAAAWIAMRLRELAVQTELRRHEAVSARREADAVLAGTADGVLGVDMDGRCTFINRAGAEMLGHVPSDFLGRDAHRFVLNTRLDGSPLPKEESPLTLALSTADSARSTEHVFFRKNGSAFPVQLSIRPMVDGRTVRGAVISFIDVTEIRRAETQLRQAVRGRDEVVAVVSHDLRNPVGTIYLAADLLLEVPLPLEKQREQLAVIQRQAKQMERLIKDLLDVTRIEGGGLPVHPSPELVGSIVDEAIGHATLLAAQKGIRMDREVAVDLPMVRADRNRILQVLDNLVGNAVKFTAAGGRVTIRARAGDEVVRFEVQDSGKGIAPQDLPHVFDRFWQVRRSDRDGAGLGLAIVKGIVEAHAGEVVVESQPGQGTTFSFTLPSLTGDPAIQRAGPQPIADGVKGL